MKTPRAAATSVLDEDLALPQARELRVMHRSTELKAQRGAGLAQPDLPVLQALGLNPILNPTLISATALTWRDISVFADASQSLP